MSESSNSASIVTVRTNSNDTEGHRACVLGRAVALLPEFHRTLIQLRSGNRCTFREIAGVLHRSAGWLCRQYARLKVRLRDPIVEALAEGAALLPDIYRNVAIGYFLLGRPPKHLAIDFGLTRRQVISMLDYVRGWAQRPPLSAA